MHQEVILGFFDAPKNQLLFRPEFTPSKAGGEPAYICPKNVPSRTCEHCGYELSFLAQLYANLSSDKYNDYHRMLYVFVCLSQDCIGKQRALRVWKCVIPDDNKVNMQFATAEEFDVVSSLTDA